MSFFRNLLDKLRAMLCSFGDELDYHPPKALAPTEPASTQVLEAPAVPAVDMATAAPVYPPEVPPAPYSPPAGGSRGMTGPA